VGYLVCAGGEAELCQNFVELQNLRGMNRFVKQVSLGTALTKQI